METIEDAVAAIARQAGAGDLPFDERLARGREIASRYCADMIREAKREQDGTELLREQLDLFREALRSAATGLDESDAGRIFMTLSEEV
jgi:hypothetical protein